MLKNWLDFWRYNRILLCALAMSLTSASSITLIGQIQWQAVFIVGLSTYAIYNLDNIFDKPHDKLVPVFIARNWIKYLIWCIFTIPLALLITFWLVIDNERSFLIFMTILGSISIAHIILTRRLLNRNNSTFNLWAERLIDSLVWCLAVVLIPVQYSGKTITPQVIMAVVYVWQLCWVGEMVWDMTNAQKNIENDGFQLTRILGEAFNIKMLKVVCATATILAITDILLGYFPWYNLSVIFAPLSNLVLISLWDLLPKAKRMFDSLFFLVNTFCGLVVVIVYLVFQK